MAAASRRPYTPPKSLLAGAAQDVDILAGGWEPWMSLDLLQCYRISMRFTEGEAVSVERLEARAEAGNKDKT